MRYFVAMSLLLLAGSVRAYDVPEVIPTAPNVSTGDTSILTSDSLPYTINSDDRVYLTDGNLHTNGNGILISTGTNRVRIDGEGDTIFFGEDGGNSYYGLQVDGQVTLLATTDVHFRAITFYHNPDDTLADLTRTCVIGGGGRVLFDTCNFHVFGDHDSTGATRARALTCYSSSIDYHSWKWRGGSWSALIWGYESRGAGDGFAAHFTVPAQNLYDLPHDSIYHLIIDDVNLTGQGGINVEGRSWISACTLNIDQRNLRYQYPSANSYYGCANQSGIGTGDSWGGCRWTHNVILGGYDFQGLDQGIQMNYMGEFNVSDGPVDSLTLVDSNYVKVHFRKDPYYGIALHAKCFTSRYGNRDFRVIGNTFIVEVGDTNTDSAWGPNGWVVKYNTGQWGDTKFLDSNVVFEGNRFEIVAKTATITEGSSHFIGVMCAIGEGLDSGVYKPLEDSVIFRHNVIKTPEWAYAFGEGDGGSQFMEILGPDTVEFFVSDVSIVQYTIAQNHGGNIPANRNYYNYVRDVVYTGTGEPDSLVNIISGYTGHSAGLKRKLTIYVKGYDKNPMNDADVWAVNAYGDTVINTTTDISGTATGVVKYWDIYSDFTDSTAYNDFTLGAQKGGDSATTSFTVGWDNHTDTLELTASAGKSKRLRGVK